MENVTHSKLIPKLLALSSLCLPAKKSSFVSCRRGSSFGAHNYIGQRPIQECAEIWKSTTASMDKSVLLLNWGDLQTATATDEQLVLQ